MKLAINNVASTFFILAGIASALSIQDSSSALKHKRGPLKPRRVQSLLINPDAQPDLPTVQAATAAASAASLNLDDIQGDVLIGMKKNRELFYFFSIANSTDFKAKLASEILPLITTTTQLLDVSTQPVTFLNIAFSQSGLLALNVTDSLGDSAFAGGQFKDLGNLGDPGSVNWVTEFAGTGIHGVLLFASDTDDNINESVASLESAMGNSFAKVYSLSRLGLVQLPSPATNDGISNPAVIGFTANPSPGQANVSSGSILVGESGDSVTRPSWAKDGSFLVFRQLKQLVPEFNKFLTDNPIIIDGLTREQGSDLLGARMVGRWKSGAPVDLAPLFDDPALGADPNRNNDFTFQHPDAVLATNQTRCPFSAHIRKTRPRADLGTPEDAVHHIMRAGIAYGPEVSTDEANSNTTSTERGLAFVAYQSNIGNGFRFLQRTWADSPNFVHSGVGVDPIIGALAGAQRVITGLDPTNSTKQTTLTTGKSFFHTLWSLAAESTFFSPSLSAIASKLSV
ncbi:DyP-type peroxidase [Mycena venus]|uniref:DyP-type peroxidase n=1 Tax=Mycena venus TaxID=2733690 RepID=A0A8H6XVC0_9AGAR|nr:DyP-type peroxidase [Mycena venus]